MSNMSQTYITRQGDVVDALVHAYYGGQKGLLEQVLNANPGLAAKGEVLPVGIKIIFPDFPKPKSKESITLW